MLNIEQLKRAEKILIESQVELSLASFFGSPEFLDFDANGKLETGHFCDSAACLAGTLALSPDFPEITAYERTGAMCHFTNAASHLIARDEGWRTGEVIGDDVYIFSETYLDFDTESQSDRLFGILGQGDWDWELGLYALLNHREMVGKIERQEDEPDIELSYRARKIARSINGHRDSTDNIPICLEEACNIGGVQEWQVAQYRLLREMGVSQKDALEKTDIEFG